MHHGTTSIELHQVREENEPMHDMPAGFFAVTATPTGGQPTSVMLVSPETYTEENCSLPPSKPARVEPSQVERLETIPGINSLTVKGQYPIADVDYNITGFPVQVSLEAYNPMCTFMLFHFLVANQWVVPIM